MQCSKLSNNLKPDLDLNDRDHVRFLEETKSLKGSKSRAEAELVGWNNTWENDENSSRAIHHYS